MVQLYNTINNGLDSISQRRIDRIYDSLSLVPKNKGAILLLRHGERFQVPHGMSKKEIPLTKMGKQSSKEIGEILNGRVEYLITSSMYSCLETSLGIATGAAYTGKMTTHHNWELPGVFIDDMEEASEILVDRGVIWTYGYLSKYPQARLPGMKSCYHGSSILIRDLHFFKIPEGKFGVYVTHDSLLATLIAGITGRRINIKNWPAYLEGFVIWIDNWKMVVANRGEIIPTNGPF